MRERHRKSKTVATGIPMNSALLVALMLSAACAIEQDKTITIATLSSVGGYLVLAVVVCFIIAFLFRERRPSGEEYTPLIN